ncbi:Predicted arabinose efflux permease, MFS family [Streptomyces misionensis]|uniref:Predicted arabinose efflux permease, MFS family n=1 Tax=Streptomyces misionensis TaxID=67331 RepID=A0A1H4I9H0_9ACTN|nr:MFS transporter [Streptomyces misionensis]SEB30641.1 Predicted arabinose efflux permease, MFS family [Streptomyces misionensis]
MKEYLENCRIFFAHREARLIFAAGFLSTAGAWLLLVCMSIVLYRAAGIGLLGLYSVLRILVPVISGPFLGQLSAAYQPRTIMIAVDLVRAVAVTVIAITAAAGGSPFLLLAIVLVCSLAGTVYAPAERRLQRDLADTENRAAANSVLGISSSLAMVIAPALSGLLGTSVSPLVLIGFDFVSFLGSAALLWRVSQRSLSDPATTLKVKSSLRIAISALAGDRVVLSCFLTQGAMSVGAGGSLVVLMPIAERATGHDSAYGWTTAAIGIGAVAGMALGAPMASKIRVRLSALCVIVMGIMLCTLVTANNWLAVLLISLSFGILANTPTALLWTVYGTRVSESKSGPLYGLVQSLIVGGNALGGVIASASTAQFGMRSCFVLGAVTAGFAAVAMIITPSPASLTEIRPTQDQAHPGDETQGGDLSRDPHDQLA